MKKKLCTAVMALLALTIVACNGNNNDDASASAPTTSQRSRASKSSSSKKPAPEVPTWPAEFPMPVARTWTEGTPAANSDGKNYTPLTDEAANKVGVKIAIKDYSSKSTGSLDSDGKLPTTAGQSIIYNIKAPKAGIYQMIMNASCSASGDDYPFYAESGDDRGIIVSVNNYTNQANVYGARLYTDAGLNHDTKVPFVVALVNLTGEEDAVAVENPYYRLKFDLNSDVVFAEL